MVWTGQCDADLWVSTPARRRRRRLQVPEAGQCTNHVRNARIQPCHSSATWQHDRSAKASLQRLDLALSFTSSKSRAHNIPPNLAPSQHEQVRDMILSKSLTNRQIASVACCSTRSVQKWLDVAILRGILRGVVRRWQKSP